MVASCRWIRPPTKPSLTSGLGAKCVPRSCLPSTWTQTAAFATSFMPIIIAEFTHFNVLPIGFHSLRR